MTEKLDTKVYVPTRKNGYVAEYTEVTLGSVAAAKFAESVFENCLPEGSTSRRILDATGATAALKAALFGETDELAEAVGPKTASLIRGESD